MKQIYYCIDTNSWYIDEDDGLYRPCREPINSEIEAVNFFIKYHDAFLNEQKEMLLSAGQKTSANENLLYLDVSTLNYIIKNNGTWTCKVCRI